MDSGLDIVLILITLAVAIVGTTLEHPSRKVKGFLIALAILASVGSILKALQDSRDKRFVKNALSSLISPKNASFRQIENQVATFASNRGYNVSQCGYNEEGMSCSFSSGPSKSQTVVLDRDDMSAIYANDLSGVSNEKLIADLFDHVYDDATINDDDWERIGNKIGIMGQVACRNIWHDTHAHFKREGVLKLTVTCDDSKKSAILYNLYLDLAARPKSGQLFEYFSDEIYKGLNPQPAPTLKR